MVYLIYIFTIYGLAWTITKSKLFLFLRNFFYQRNVSLSIEINRQNNSFFTKTLYYPLYYSYKFLYELTKCIVCTSFWVSLLITILFAESTLFSDAFFDLNIFDFVILAFSSMAFVWLIAYNLEDAS